MSGAVYRWTPEAIRRAQEILSRHESLDSAFAELSHALGFTVTRSGIDCAFDAAELETPFRHLLKRKRSRLDVPVPPIGERDTERVFVSAAVPLPDDSSTTAPASGPRVELVAEPSAAEVATATSSESPSTAADLAAHRYRERIAMLEATKKRLLKELADKEDELLSFKAIARQPRPIEAIHKVGGTQRTGVPLAIFSDWHVEEEVDPATINGLNEYNLDIADRCIDKLAESYVGMIDDSPRFDCRTGVICILGDLFSGHIHDELLEMCAMAPQETMVWLLDRLERMLRKIAATTHLERIIVACLSGNHGRATEKIRVSTREANSNEQVIYQTLARVMRDEPRFEFHIAAGQWLELDVMGYQIAATHGDSFHSQGGIGGISIPIRRGIARQFAGRKFHQYLMGHFHQRQDFGNIQVNGSMIGYSPYSQWLHAEPEPRQQAWFMIDSKRGKCVTAPLWCDP